MTIFALARAAFAALLTAVLTNPVAAQQWPARSVKLIVPYPAGGNVDGAARIVADRLQTMLGQPFIVENKAGAGGRYSIGHAVMHDALDQRAPVPHRQRTLSACGH